MARKRRRFTAEFKARVGLEGAARAGQRAGDRGAARTSSELGDHMEAAAARRVAEGVCRGRGPQGRPGARGEDPGSAREDRGTHGRAGFFSARAQALSRAERGRIPGGSSRLDQPPGETVGAPGPNVEAEAVLGPREDAAVKTNEREPVGGGPGPAEKRRPAR